VHATVRQLDPWLLTLGPSRSDRVNGDLRLESSAGRARMVLEGQTNSLAFGTRGWLRPFDTVPSYDLTAWVRRLRSGASVAWLDRLLGGHGGNVSLRVWGRGADARRADLRALATLEPGGSPRGLLDSGSVDVRLAGGTADVRARVGATQGLITFKGTVTLDSEPEYRIERGSLEGVDLAALLGDTSASALNATFSLSGRGTSRATARVDASILAAGSSYGGRTLTDGRMDLSLRGGDARLTARTNLDGGSLELEAVGDPFSSRPGLTVRRLRFRHLDLARLVPSAGIASDLSGTATLRARGRRLDHVSLSGRVVLEDSRVGPQGLNKGVIQASLSRGNLQLQGELDATAGWLAVSGVARPFDSVPTYAIREGTFRDLDLGPLLGLASLHTRLAGSLEAEGSGRRPESGRLTGALTLGESTVNRIAIRNGRLDATLLDGRIHVDGKLLGAGDSLTIDGDIDPFGDRPHVRLASSVSVGDLAPLLEQDSLNAGGAAWLAIEGELGRREMLDLRGELRAEGHVDRVSVDSLWATLRLANGVLEVDTLSLGSNVASATGAGGVALFRPGAAGEPHFRLQGQLLDLSPLAPWVGVDSLALRSGSFTASVDGPSDRVRLGLVIEGAGLAQGRRRAGTVHASLEGELAADRSVTEGKAELILKQLSAPGNQVQEIRLQGSYLGRQLALRGETIVDRARGARVVLRAYPDSAEPRVWLDTLEAQTGRAAWALSHPVRITYGDRIQVEDFVLAAGGRRIAIDGAVDRRGEQDLRVKVDSVRLAWFSDLFGLGELDGEAGGSLNLTGPAAAPLAIGTLAVDVRSRGKAVGSVRGHVDWAGARGLELDFGLYHPEGDSLRLTGQIPVALSLAPESAHLVSRIADGKLELDASANDFRLAKLEPLLDPEKARSLRGLLTMDAHARGSMEKPELSGEIDFVDAEIQLRSLGAKYEKGQVRMALQGREVKVTQARIESGGGRLEAEGTIGLGTFPEAAFDLRSTFDNFQMAAAENFRSRISGALQLGGTTGEPMLAGSVEVKNSDIYVQTKNLQGSAEAVELTPADLQVLEQRFGYITQPPPGPAGGVLFPWGLHLDVGLAGNDWLRRRSDPVVAVELQGKLEVRKEPREDIRIFGTIKPVPGRSFVQVLGRRFEVVGGAVDLSGPLADARMSLQAEYRPEPRGGTTPSGALITAQVKADTSKLDVTLGSVPVMSDEDIVSYLTTGLPKSSDPTVASDEPDVLTTGASLAVGAALGSVAGGAGQGLGLDVVQVLQDREGGQTLVGGKYVSPPLYFGFRQPIVDPPDKNEPSNSNNTVEFEVEYAAFRRALLNVQGAGSEFRMFLRLRQ
jgi:translocation and assembly module TamB